MMKFYSLKNAALGFYNRPFTAGDDLHAKALIRNVLLHDEDGELKKQLADAELWFVGEFDSEKGCFFRYKSKPEFICNVADIPVVKE